MKKKTFKCVISLFIFCICGMCSLSTSAKNNIPLEGQFEKEDARSVVPEKPVMAYLDGTQLSLDFYQWLPEVIIMIKDEQGKVIFCKTFTLPKNEVLNLVDLEIGVYTLELQTNLGYMQGQFSIKDNN